MFFMIISWISIHDKSKKNYEKSIDFDVFCMIYVVLKENK